jgi:hypothetical protein
MLKEILRFLVQRPVFVGGRVYTYSMRNKVAALPIIKKHPVCRVCGTDMVRTGRATYCAVTHTQAMLDNYYAKG